jgi:2-polyprenyl-3-methyl-5-hydroxy-6-metoxy-1,4-benzoquinol methylase
MNVTRDAALESRALQTLGESSEAFHRAAVEALRHRSAAGSVVDVGCGTGRLRDALAGVATSYVGVDAVRHGGFPGDARLLLSDLDRDVIPLPDGSADVVVALETIEHLENPRAFCRDLARVARPGGWLVVSTPNQRSVGSLGALLFKEHFSAFRGNCYPAHRTALLDTDLCRIASEIGLDEIAIVFTGAGRVPLTARPYPRFLSRALPRACSDNVLLVARRPLR